MLASALAEGMLPDIKIYEAHRLMNYLGFALVTDSTAGTRSGSFRSNIAEVHHLIRVSPGKNMGVSIVYRNSDFSGLKTIVYLKHPETSILI